MIILLTARSQSIPLIHEMGAPVRREDLLCRRKGLKVYLTDPLCVDVNSITTQHEQHLYLSGADAALMQRQAHPDCRRRDLHRRIAQGAGKARRRSRRDCRGRMAVLAEGDAQERSDIVYLEKLPVFNADGTVKG